MLVDSHCHLDYFEGEELDAVIARAADAGVGRLVTIGTRLAQAATVKAITQRSDRVWGTVGVHPLHIGEGPLPTVAEIVAAAEHPRVVGIGESGLDYHYDAAPAEVQIEGFRRHCRAARETGLPLVVHAREADADVARVLEEERAGEAGFVLHCFSSGRELAERAVALGGYVSFSGILTFPKSGELREIARALPAERILVETDAPYLAPVPRRGKRNEPALVVHTARVLAATRGVSEAAVAELTTANFGRLFSRAA